MAVIEKISVQSLTLDPRNARKHSKKNLKSIKGSLKKFGQQKPIVISSEGIVVAGNGTLEAAKELGWETIDVVRSELKGSELTAYAIADNRTGELAEWNLDILPGTLEALGKEFDLEEIGFDENDLAKLLPQKLNEGLIGDDDIPEVKDTRCKLGDLWLLGEHRLLCGDSTDVLQVERLMGGEKADMVFTSPPYSDLRDYRGEIDLTVSHLTCIFEIPAKTFFVNLGLKIKNRKLDRYFDEWISEAEKRNLPLIAWLVWDKGNASGPAHQQAMFGLSHEWVFVFGEYRQQNLIKENKGTESWGRHTGREADGSLKARTQGEKRAHRQLDTVIRCNKAITGFSGLNHPAMMPIELAETFILSHTNRNEIVCEPFCGSGSTLIACEKTGRKCYGMELDPYYCDVILSRWEKFTGKQASLLSEG